MKEVRKGDGREKEVGEIKQKDGERGKEWNEKREWKERENGEEKELEERQLDEMESNDNGKGEVVSFLVSRCFESSQPQRITSGLKRNFSLSPSYS